LTEQLFNPAVVLPIPGKGNKSTSSNMREAVKTETKPKLPKLEGILEHEHPVGTIPLAESTLENISPPNTSDTKKLILTRSKDKVKMGYIVDRKNVRYIDDLSTELKYGEIQNHHPSIIVDEFLRIGQFFYEKYSHKLVDTITSGDQISEFILSEFRKEFNIVVENE